MPNSRFYSSTAAVTNLQVTAAPGDNSIQVASSSGFPGSFPFTLDLDYGSANSELVDVTAGGPSTFTVNRAIDGTSATTHNAGAVVRHVSSARDFTDSRTHESSTTGVHGTTGAIVDTGSTQTLNNKTLNSPVINNGTITGTVTGGTISGVTLSGDTISGATTMSSPTLSGAWTNTGDITNTGQLLQQNLVKGQRAGATDSVYEARVTGDAAARWLVTTKGDTAWGDGTNPIDVELFRPSAGKLQVSGNLAVTGTVGVTGAISGSSTIAATGNLTGAEVVTTTNTWTPFTPTWSGIGTATFNTNVGWYWKLGKIVFFEIYGVWGSNGTGTGGVAVQFPTTPFRDGNGPNTTRQHVTGGILNSNGGVVDGVLSMYAFASDTGPTGATLRRFDGIQIQGNNMITGTIATIEGWYREA